MEEIGQSIRNQIIDPRKGRDPRKAHLPRSLKQFPIPTTVRFSDALHGHTAIEVTAQDRPGLLYQIAEAFDACDIKLHNARVGTFGAYVEDIFEVTDLSGKPLNNEEQRSCLAEQISERLDETPKQETLIEF